MTYLLGIDLGTTFTAAAVCRRVRDGWGPAEVVPLGTRDAVVGSVLFADRSGGWLFGDAAERRVASDPTRVVREFKRRIGDHTPLLVGDQTHTAHDLAARLVRWVVDTVAGREGAAPEMIAVTHPAGWGRHKTSLLNMALREAGVADVVLLSEPHAAAIRYASAERVAPGAAVAVYDLGGGTFDATVLRTAGPDTFELLGEPVGHERLGGLDFDELVFEHLRGRDPDAFARLDPRDPAQLAAVVRLRRECREAKEGLSEDTEVVIPILLPHTQARARLVRAEFEAMIRPAVEETIDLLASAVRGAGLATDELAAVLLVGGSARIPLVTELVSAAIGRPVTVDPDPKASVALGAVLALRAVAGATDLARPDDHSGPDGRGDPDGRGGADRRASLDSAAGPADESDTVRGAPLPESATALTSARPPERPVGQEQRLVLHAPEPPRRWRPRGRTLIAVGGLLIAALTVSTITGLPEHLAGITSPAHAATTTSSPAAAGGAADAASGNTHAGYHRTTTGQNGRTSNGTGANPGAPAGGDPAAASPTTAGKPGTTPTSAVSLQSGTAPTTTKTTKPTTTPKSTPPTTKPTTQPPTDPTTTPPSTKAVPPTSS